MSYVRYPPVSGGGGGAVWGAITGTLSAQTDLQAALDAKLSIPPVETLDAVLLSDAAGGSKTTPLTVNSGGDLVNSTIRLSLAGDTFIGMHFNTVSALWYWDGGAQYSFNPDTQIIFGQGAGTTGSFLIKGNDNNVFNDAVSGTVRAGNGAGSRAGGSLTLKGGDSGSGTGGNLILSGGASSGTAGKVILDQATASRAAVIDADKGLTSSSVTSTELGYLSGVTSDIQTQINTLNTTLAPKLNENILFGSGQDGALTISSGTTTLDRDRYYSSITITGTAKLSTAGFRVYCSGILDLSAAPLAAIEDVTTSAANASGTAAGTQAGALTVAELGRGNRGVIGVAGGTTTGVAGTAGGATAVALNQVTGSRGGAGGLGASGAGGASGAAPTITARKVAYGYQPVLIRGVTLASGGGNGSAGGSGGGDGTAGGGSGGGGSGGGVVFIAARTINRGGSTAAGAIRAIGGNGGNGGTPAGGNRGGGGGGGGGAGGYVQLVYGTLTGSTASDMIRVSGGNGGNGGNGLGTGVGGNGGDGGPGGVIVLVDATAGTTSVTLGTALVAGGAASGTTGGTGATGQATQASL